LTLEALYWIKSIDVKDSIEKVIEQKKSNSTGGENEK